MDRQQMMRRLAIGTAKLDHLKTKYPTVSRIKSQLVALIEAERLEVGGFSKKLKTMHCNGSGAYMICNFFNGLMDVNNLNYAAQQAQQAFKERYGQGAELPHIGGLMMAFHILGHTNDIAKSVRILHDIDPKDVGIQALLILLAEF